MVTRIEHTEIREGDTIILAYQPAIVTSVSMFMGYANVTIRRHTGATGRYYIGAPVNRLDHPARSTVEACRALASGS
jgi:hypothetical protein